MFSISSEEGTESGSSAEFNLSRNSCKRQRILKHLQLLLEVNIAAVKVFFLLVCSEVGGVCI